MTRSRTPWLQYACTTSTMRSVDKDHNISRTSSNACTTLGADVAGRCRTTMWTSSSVLVHPEVYQHQRPTSLMTASNTWSWPMAWLFTSDMLGGKMWMNHKWLLLFDTVLRTCTPIRILGGSFCTPPYWVCDASYAGSCMFVFPLLLHLNICIKFIHISTITAINSGS